MIRAWGNIQEVEIEQRPDAVIIKPKTTSVGGLRDLVISEMKAAGLVEELPWTQLPQVSARDRAHLAEKLSHGSPLSDVIIEDREEYA
jgi:hypothetical protein